MVQIIAQFEKLTDLWTANDESELSHIPMQRTDWKNAYGQIYLFLCTWAHSEILLCQRVSVWVTYQLRLYICQYDVRKLDCQSGNLLSAIKYGNWNSCYVKSSCFSSNNLCFRLTQTNKFCVYATDYSYYLCSDDSASCLEIYIVSQMRDFIKIGQLPWLANV